MASRRCLRGGYILPFFEKLGENVPSLISGCRVFGLSPRTFINTVTRLSLARPFWRSQEEQSYHSHADH